MIRRLYTDNVLGTRLGSGALSPVQFRGAAIV